MRYTVPQVITDAFPDPADQVFPARLRVTQDDLVLEVFVRGGAWTLLATVRANGDIIRTAAPPTGFRRGTEP